MADKNSFSTDEWKTIVTSMPMVGMAVVAASPSGPFGVVKEMMSIGMTLAEVLQKGSSNPLISAIVADMKARGTRPEPPTGITNPEQAKTAALDHLAKVATVVDAKCSESEAKEFKQWLLDIGQRVAEASTEGGFMGFGGVKVSDAEKEAIGEMAKVLKA